jgi:hypothetical protein
LLAPIAPKSKGLEPGRGGEENAELKESSDSDLLRLMTILVVRFADAGGWLGGVEEVCSEDECAGLNDRYVECISKDLLLRQAEC